jgi:hypothetical protein
MSGDISTWPVERVLVATLVSAAFFGAVFFAGWFAFIGWDMWKARRAYRMRRFDGPEEVE